MTMTLHDRAEAGRLLARKLRAYGHRLDVVVLGLPRGGVLVAYGIATALRVPLDIFVVRKLGVPGYEEFALGAVATGGVKIIDPDVVEEFHLSDAEIAGVVRTEQAELQRREMIYRSTRPAPDLRNRTVILVDDGIATGSTMRAAIEGVKRCGAARVVVTAGVAPLSTSLMLGAESDEVVCLLTPRDFRAVGPFYNEFAQVNDQEVCDVLNKSWNAGARTAAQ
jgi:putative phosphoribosyl transferase